MLPLSNQSTSVANKSWQFSNTVLILWFAPVLSFEEAKCYRLQLWVPPLLTPSCTLETTTFLSIAVCMLHRLRPVLSPKLQTHCLHGCQFCVNQLLHSRAIQSVQHGSPEAVAKVQQRRREALSLFSGLDHLHCLLIKHREGDLWPVQPAERDHFKRVLGLLPPIPEPVVIRLPQAGGPNQGPNNGQLPQSGASPMLDTW